MAAPVAAVVACGSVDWGGERRRDTGKGGRPASRVAAGGRGGWRAGGWKRVRSCLDRPGVACRQVPGGHVAAERELFR